MKGTADWHYLRKFSLTSSQANRAFLQSIVEYKDDPSWAAIALYLYGNDWMKILNLTPATPPLEESNDGASEGSSERQNNDDDQPGADPFDPPCIKDYLCDGIAYDESIVCAREKLLSFVVPDVDNDNDKDGMCLSAQEAKEEYATWSRETRVAALKLLVDHVHKEHQKSNPSKANVLMWLQKSNPIRDYLFYSSSALKIMMNKKGIMFAPGSGHISMDRRIAALAGVIPSCSDELIQRTANNGRDTPVTSKEATIRALLEKSFLPHQKGKNREYCSLGHRLEVPILRGWVRCLPEARQYRDIQVRGAYAAGLAAKKGSPWAKDSIDFILVVDDGLDDVSTWGFEAKGRVTANTAADEEADLLYSFDRHQRINQDEAHEHIVKVDERFQVMQHAYVYDFETVVLAIADNQAEIIRSCVISFSFEIKEHFGKVLTDLKDVALDWAYPAFPPGRNAVLKIPEHVSAIADTIPTINGRQCLQGTANLWFAMCQRPKPFPSVVRILPAIYAFWNVVKGGSDTATKLMDDCLVQIPKTHMNTETVAISRCLMLVLVQNHRLMQALSADSELNYPSLLHYRHAASKRQTFHSTLLLHAKLFRNMFEDEKRAANAATIVEPPDLRRAPRRQRIDGAIPEEMTFAARLPFATPNKRIGKLIRKETAATEVQDMVYNCTGQIMQLYPAKADIICDYCRSNKTSWYCAGCKQWLCMTRRMVKNGSSTNPLELYCRPFGKKQEDKQFMKMCYHKVHEAAWARSSNNVGGGRVTP
jgi:hypothetical protein